MYRVGFPGWKIAARLGVPMLVRIDVVRDLDANVLVATSPDLHGLVVEAKTVADLMRDAYDCIDMLMEEALHQPPKNKTLAAWNGEAFAA